ncbi:MAG: LLM class flavin-dependent oxidoreductase [Haloferacaceae archaeon]
MSSHGYLLPTRGAVFASDSPATLAANVESDVVGAATRAEALGFDDVWVGDSVLAKPRLEPFTTLAAVASATDAVGIGTAVYLPALRHPVHVAHQTATLDQVSGGRLSLGVGVGVRDVERREAEQLDVDFERRGARLDETLSLLSRLWTGDAVTHDGEFFSLSDASVGFSPVSDPPIYVASAAFDPKRGFPRPIRERLAERGDGWLPIAVSPESYAAGLDAARAAVADAGRDADALDAAFYHDVVVADTEADALARARDFFRSYYPEDEQMYEDEPLTDEQLKRRGAFGPPAVVAEHLDRYREAGVERFVTRFPAADQRTQLRRFADLL